MNSSESLFALIYLLVIVVSNSFGIPASPEDHHDFLLNNHNEVSSKHTRHEESNNSYYTVENLPKEYKVLLSNSSFNGFHNLLNNKNPRNKVVKIIYRKRVKGSPNGNNNKHYKVSYDWVRSNDNVDDIESGQTFYSTGNHKTSSGHLNQFDNTLVESNVYKPHRLSNNHRINRIIRINKVKKGYIKDSELTEHSKDGNHNLKYVKNIQSHHRDRVPDSSVLLFQQYYSPKHKKSKADWANYGVNKVSLSQPSISKTMKVDNDYVDWESKQHEDLDENNIISEKLNDVESENTSKEILPEKINDEVHVSEENNNEYMTSEDVHNVSIHSKIASYEKVPSSHVINEDTVDREYFVHNDGTSNGKGFSKGTLSTLDDNASADDIENYVYATPKKDTIETVNTNVPLRDLISNNISVTTKTRDMSYEDVFAENDREVLNVSSDEISNKNYFNKPTHEVIENVISEEQNSDISDNENVPSKNVSLYDFVPKDDANIFGDAWSEDVTNKVTREEIPTDNVDDEVFDTSFRDINNEKGSSEENDSALIDQPTKTIVVNKEISSDVPFENVVNVVRTKPKSKYAKTDNKSLNYDWVTSINNAYHKLDKVTVPGHALNVPSNYDASELIVFEKILTEICDKAKKLLGSKPNAAVINRLKLILKELNVLYQLIEENANIKIKDKSLPIRILEFIHDKTIDNDDFSTDQEKSRDFNDIKFSEDSRVIAVPITDQFDTDLRADENKVANFNSEDYYFKLLKLLRDLKRLRPENYDSTLQSQLKQLVEYLNNYIHNNMNMVKSSNMKTHLIPILQALRSEMEKSPKSPKERLKWNMKQVLPYLHGQLNNDVPLNYDSNRNEVEDLAKDPFGRKLYEVLDISDKGFTDDSVNFIVHWLSSNDDNAKVKRNIDERTVREALKLFQENGITMENLKKLIVYLYNNSNSNHRHDCTATTYRNMLQKSLMFLTFVSDLTTKDNWHKNRTAI